MKSFAVIIPVGPGDYTWEKLLPDLGKSPVEIILVGVTSAPLKFPKNIRWVRSEMGRAKQLNAGVEATQKKYLWFLHADSRLHKNTLSALLKSVRGYPHALHYFNLHFLKDGPWLTLLNQKGVWIRSHFFGLPFGDQGFCISRELFYKLGGFSEEARFGEDHHFVWKARKNGIKVHCTGAALSTSARKYQTHGWMKTTLRHAVLTLRQVLLARFSH